ncbi:MAG: glycosyltransferase, partial [Candidatus Zipacnadales bacterium]
MDVLLFPSKGEGYGRVVLEAQAAGLPCIISDVIPSEIDVVPALVTRLSLTKPAPEWARQVLTALDTGPSVTQSQALSVIEDSLVNIEQNVLKLESLYTEAVKHARRSDTH